MRQIDANQTNWTGTFDYAESNFATISNIWWNIWEGDDTCALGQNCFNTLGLKYLTLRTQGGGKFLQDTALDCTLGQEYEWQRQKLLRAIPGMSQEVFQRIGTWMESFDFKQPPGIGEDARPNKVTLMGG